MRLFCAQSDQRLMFVPAMTEFVPSGTPQGSSALYWSPAFQCFKLPVWLCAFFTGVGWSVISPQLPNARLKVTRLQHARCRQQRKHLLVNWGSTNIQPKIANSPAAHIGGPPCGIAGKFRWLHELQLANCILPWFGWNLVYHIRSISMQMA